jgi:glycosyltransferase involved in cell wall biosynthesis
MGGALVSVAFPCCQQQAYVRSALRSVLAQTYSPLEIVISDDASSDGTWEAVQQEVASYRGSHAIRMNRNEQRLGVENYNVLMGMAQGDFVVVAHSDDVSVPHRVERLVAAWRDQAVSLVSSNALVIDAQDRPAGVRGPDQPCTVSLSSIITQGWRPEMLGATLAWERDVFDRFGPLQRSRSPISTDWILPFRAALLRGMHYVSDPLIHYRVHPESRARKFLSHNADDPAADAESHCANRTAQFVYMLETLRAYRSDGGGDGGELQQAEQLLARSILSSAISWTRARNQLLADRKQVRWLPAS